MSNEAYYVNNFNVLPVLDIFLYFDIFFTSIVASPNLLEQRREQLPIFSPEKMTIGSKHYAKD